MTAGRMPTPASSGGLTGQFLDSRAVMEVSYMLGQFCTRCEEKICREGYLYGVVDETGFSGSVAGCMNL